ncbi:WG repeat-containing protein [Eubacterium ventriosum]|jgi:hypothetical protein
MRKKFIILLVTVLLIMATGCGKATSSSSKDVTTNNTSKDITNSANVQSDKETLNLVKGSGFYGGVATVENSDGERFAIDTNGKKLFSLDEYDDILFFDNVSSRGDTLIDKNGNIIASPEKNGYTGLCTQYCDGYALAYYLKDEYPNVQLKLGVLNGKGEWVVPLSENHKILKEMKKHENNLFDYISNVPEVFKSLRIYMAITDDINDIMLQTFVETGTQTNGFIYCYKNGIFYITLDAENFFYDAQNDKILKDVPNATIPYQSYIKYGEKMEELEKKFNTHFSVYSDGYYASFITNDIGTSYFCVYDEKGNEMFKPIQTDSSTSDKNDYKCICIDRNGFVIENEIENTFSYYNITGDLITTYENVDSMQPFYEGLALVKYEGKIRYIDVKGNTIIE